MAAIKKIRELIKSELSRGIKKSEIARRIGISQSTLWSYMNLDVTPDLQTLEKISKAYKIPLEHFSGDDNSSSFASEPYRPTGLTNRQKAAVEMIIEFETKPEHDIAIYRDLIHDILRKVHIDVDGILKRYR